MGWKEFVAINSKIDDMFEYIDEDDNDDGDDIEATVESDETNKEYSPRYEAEEGQIMKVFDETDVWGYNCNLDSVFDKDFIAYLTNFFNQHSDDEGMYYNICLCVYVEYTYIHVYTYLFRPIHLSLYVN